ncbi:hypothetical protein [Bradyrhizobium prioriisuperbiae]|uniref:hypothetical protein n=1 Tax=Bradyrhizobium prioriisuperbiae TaxID=2854389 RepID=UPI0028EE04C2|nr:hypothetical protein [Bradyrhizobium prioritasuperba]
MDWRSRTSGLKALGLVRLLLVAACGATVAGCAGGADSYQGPMAAMASASVPAGGRTVTFESIDGPPPQVFDRFVRVLDNESQTRNVAIVSRDSAAGYRIRSYLAAQVRGGRTIIAWVWDVYDGNQQRTLRLSGEEQGGKAGRDAWAVADEPLLRRIAQAGLISLSGFVNGTAPPDLPAEPPAASSGPAIASADAIFRESSAESSKALGFSAH